MSDCGLLERRRPSCPPFVLRGLLERPLRCCLAAIGGRAGSGKAAAAPGGAAGMERGREPVGKGLWRHLERLQVHGVGRLCGEASLRLSSLGLSSLPFSLPSCPPPRSQSDEWLLLLLRGREQVYPTSLSPADFGSSPLQAAGPRARAPGCGSGSAGAVPVQLRGVRRRGTRGCSRKSPRGMAGIRG